MAECIHHYYMGISNGGRVTAKCRKCGEEKAYSADAIYKHKFIPAQKIRKVIIHPKSCGE